MSRCEHMLGRHLLWMVLAVPAPAWADEPAGSVLADPSSSSPSTKAQPGSPAPSAVTSLVDATLSADGRELRTRIRTGESGEVREQRVGLAEPGQGLLTRGTVIYVRHARGFSIVKVAAPVPAVRQVNLTGANQGWAWELSEKQLVVRLANGTRISFLLDDPANSVTITPAEVPQPPRRDTQYPVNPLDTGHNLREAGSILITTSAIIATGGEIAALAVFIKCSEKKQPNGPSVCGSSGGAVGLAGSSAAIAGALLFGIPGAALLRTGMRRWARANGMISVAPIVHRDGATVWALGEF